MSTHQQNRHWLDPLFSLAAIMQLAEVEMKTEELAPLIEARPDKSSHPESGPRPNGDGMLKIFEKLVLPAGQEPPSQITRDVFEAGAEDLCRRAVAATVAEINLTAHIRFGKTRTLLQVLGRAEHPGLGNGLLFLLRLLLDKTGRKRTDPGRILRMNAHETVAMETGHFLGSWCMDSAKQVAVPVFVTFIPTVLCTPKMCLNMIHSTAMHARWAEDYFRMNLN
jgi:hypothetical protein